MHLLHKLSFELNSTMLTLLVKFKASLALACEKRLITRKLVNCGHMFWCFINLIQLHLGGGLKVLCSKNGPGHIYLRI